MLTSRDPVTQHVTTMEIQREQALKRPKFQPMQLTRDVMVEDPGVSRRGLVARTKVKVTRDDANSRHEHVESLPQQGQLMRETDEEAAEVWSAALNSLPSKDLKSALNGASDTLPHNSNLYLSGEGERALLMAVSCVEESRHYSTFLMIARSPWS